MCWLWRTAFYIRQSSRPGKKARVGAMNSNSINRKEIRKFGLVAFIFFGVLLAFGLWRSKAFAVYFFGFLTLVSIGFILMPLQLRSVYAAWLKIAHVIGTAVTILLLTILFYLVITPAALIKSVFGGRPLPLKPDKNGESIVNQRILGISENS
jgi:hypothetical protein